MLTYKGKRIGVNMAHALSFISRVDGWHSFTGRDVMRSLLSLERMGLVNIAQSARDAGQFRITESGAQFAAGAKGEMDAQAAQSPWKF